MSTAEERAQKLLEDPNLAGAPWVDDGDSIGSRAPINGNVICLKPPLPAFIDSHARWPSNKRFIVASRQLIPELLGDLATCREALNKTRIEADKAFDEATFARAELKQAHAQILKLAMDLDSLRQTVKAWLDKQGHDRCWYYPDLFRELAKALGLNPTKQPALPSIAEFQDGCRRYQQEEYQALPEAHTDGCPGGYGTSQTSTECAARCRLRS